MHGNEYAAVAWWSLMMHSMWGCMEVAFFILKESEEEKAQAIMPHSAMKYIRHFLNAG